MAEFIRIWESATRLATQEDIDNSVIGTDGVAVTAIDDPIENGDYVEYDTTIVETEIVGLPVSPVSISRTTNVGVVQRTIDITEIRGSAQSVDVSQTSRPITVEKSDANRYSIEASPANPINIEVSRPEITVIQSGIGQRGIPGADGEDSIADFDAALRYERGDLTRFDKTSWISLVTNDGRIDLLSAPEEGDLWSEVASVNTIDNLPLTSGYEIGTQEEWDIIEPIIKTGDLIRATQDITIDIVNDSEAGSVLSSSNPIVDEDGNSYIPVSNFGNTRFTLETRGTRSAAKFLAALDELGILYAQDNPTDNTPIFQGRSESGLPFTITRIAGDIFFMDGSPVSSNPNAIDINTFERVRSTLFGATPPGVILRLPIRDQLEIGDNIVVKTSDGGREVFDILDINENNILGERSFLVAGLPTFKAEDIIFGRVTTSHILSERDWYVRNSEFFSQNPKIDALGVTSSTSDSLQEVLTALDEQEEFNVNLQNQIDGNTFADQDKDRVRLLFHTLFGGRTVNERGGDTPGFNKLDANGRLTDDSRNDPESFFNLQADDFIGIQDGAQQNYIDNVDEGNSALVTTTTTETITGSTRTREVRTLSTTAERNIVDGVITGSGLEFVKDENDAITRELTINSTATGGSGEGNRLILLNSEGIIPSTAISQINLSDVTIFETISSRDGFTDKAWSTGDTAIVSGVPNLSIEDDAFTDGGTTIVITKLDNSADINDNFDPLPTSGDINLVSNTNVFRRLTYTYDASTDLVTDTSVADQVTFTHTLTVTEAFTSEDVIDFLTNADRNTITTPTGTFVYKSPDQTAGTPPAETRGQVTTKVDWAEIVPTGGVVTSINGSSGVVTLGIAQVNDLPKRLSTIEGTIPATFAPVGAEVNVQSDWNQGTTTKDNYIENKPTKLSDFTNDQGFIASSVAAPIGVYHAIKKVSGNEIEVIAYVSGDTIEVEDLEADGYVLLAGTTAEIIHVIGTCSDSQYENAEACQLNNETWTVNNTATLQRIQRT